MSEYLGLVINTNTCKLPPVGNEFFILESYNSVLFDDVPRTNTIKFYIEHQQSDLFVKLLGIENTFIFHRVILSLYNSAYKLQKFSREFNLEDKDDISVSQIESKIQEYSLKEFDFKSLEYADFLTYSETGRGLRPIYSNKNEIQELMWAMNLEPILNNYGLIYFDDLFNNLKDSEFNLTQYQYTVNKMLHNRELSMVMHTWGKLKDYNRPDFISIISNILEFIKKDYESNMHSFIRTRSESMYGIFKLFEEVLNFVTQNPTRKYFFKMFNDAKMFGFISRHGSNSLEIYNRLSQDDKSLSVDQIILNMENKVIPNQAELQHLFNFWHYTTSVLVSLWFRLRRTPK